MSEAPERPPIDWEAIADALASFGKDVIDRLGTTMKKNTPHTQKGEYRFDDLLEDVTEFWRAAAGDVERGVGILRDNVTRRTDVS